MRHPEVLAVFDKIGKNVADLIEDGSTLQMGIGAHSGFSYEIFV